MLRIHGSKKTLCDGLTRRDLLHVGGLGLFGLSLADALRLDALAAHDRSRDGSFGRAKACILLFLFGSPPQHETFDPKPEAPPEIQGETKAIPTSVPGVHIGEYLPQVARVVDRTTIVRSMTHPYPLHGVAYALTGMPTYTPEIEAKPRDPQHWPFLGSVLHYLEQTQSAASPNVPSNIGLPWVMGSKASDYPPLAGPYAAFLGSSHDPVWTDFPGKGTRVVPKLTDAQTQDVRDPFAGIEPHETFTLSDAGSLLEGVTGNRLASRRGLLQQFDDARGWLDNYGEVDAYEKHRATAYSLLTSPKVRNALDVRREPDEFRRRYGMTLFGQATLAARRLVEAGGRFISVFWDPYGPFGGSCWDTHANHFPRLKQYLLPVFDQTYSALILDLEQRGLLDETLVLCISEHGRTPQIDSKPKGAGRHHWSRAYSAIFAGGGVAHGKVVGRTDPSGGDVAATPVSPKDVLATTYHLLGINPHSYVRDRLGRPVPIAGSGHVRGELLA